MESASRPAVGDDTTAAESSARRDRRLILSGIGLVAALSWLYVIPAARDMYGSMSGLASWMMHDDWTARYGLLVFLMWTVMMAAMMLPTAVPALLTFATIVRRRPDPDRPVARSYAFAGGYLLAWTVFSVAATVLQWLLAEAKMLSPMMESASAPMSGFLLVLAGVYQWTPLKSVCLDNCRSPMIELSRRWRSGVAGALRMGLEHGLFCIGCCWALMLLLFAAGVMSLAAITAITMLVLLEKLAPFGAFGGRVGGAAMVIAGVWIAVG
jgi:predicted metal-binding membrane protein